MDLSSASQDSAAEYLGRMVSSLIDWTIEDSENAAPAGEVVSVSTRQNRRRDGETTPYHWVTLWSLV